MYYFLQNVLRKSVYVYIMQDILFY